VNFKHDPDMSINQSGLALLMSYEDFRPKPYDDGTGTVTIGYGHTRSPVMPASVTEEEAAELLKDDLRHFEEIVRKEVRTPLNHNQFSALVSLVYNIGEGAFRNSTLLQKLNNGNYQAASNEFEKWVKGGGRELKGLVRRRAAERQLFMTMPIPQVNQEVMSGMEFIQKSIIDEETKEFPANVAVNSLLSEASVMVTFVVAPVYDPTVPVAEEEEPSEVSA
jgi:lysozyme